MARPEFFKTGEPATGTRRMSGRSLFVDKRGGLAAIAATIEACLELS